MRAFRTNSQTFSQSGHARAPPPPQPIARTPPAALEVNTADVPLLAALTDTFTARLALRATVDPKDLEVVAGLPATIEACGVFTNALAVLDGVLAEMERMATALERATIDETDMLISSDDSRDAPMDARQANVSINFGDASTLAEVKIFQTSPWRKARRREPTLAVDRKKI